MKVSQCAVCFRVEAQLSVAKGGWVFLKSLFYVLHLTITVEYKIIGANLIICGRFEFCQN